MNDPKTPEGLSRSLAKKIVLLHSGDAELASRVEKEISKSGYEMVGPIRRELSPAAVREARALVWDQDSPPDLSGTELLAALAQKKNMPVVVIGKSPDPDVQLEKLPPIQCEYVPKDLFEKKFSDALSRAMSKAAHVEEYGSLPEPVSAVAPAAPPPQAPPKQEPVPDASKASETETDIRRDPPVPNSKKLGNEQPESMSVRRWATIVSLVCLAYTPLWWVHKAPVIEDMVRSFYFLLLIPPIVLVYLYIRDTFRFSP